MGEGEWPKEAGNLYLYPSEVNTFQGRVRQVYTGNGYDSTKSATGTDAQDHELDAVLSTGLASATYAKITVIATVQNNSADTGAIVRNYVQLKIQTKETGGAYGDALAYTNMGTQIPGQDFAGDVITTTNTISFVYYHTLTAGEKTNGFQVKMFSQSVNATNAYTCSFTNIQTVLEVV